MRWSKPTDVPPPAPVDDLPVATVARVDDLPHYHSPAPRATAKPIAVRFVDNHEQAVLGEVQMPSDHRTVSLQYQGATFVAARQLPDGTWIYRLMGK